MIQPHRDGPVSPRSKQKRSMQDDEHKSETRVRFRLPGVDDIFYPVKNENHDDEQGVITTNRISVALAARQARLKRQGSLTESKTTIQKSRQEKIIRALEREFIDDVQLVKPGRVFVRDGVLGRLNKFGIRKADYHVHLFTDMIIYSEKTARGFRLRHAFDLADCDVHTSAEDGKKSANNVFGLIISCGPKEVVFEADNMKALMSWSADIRMMIRRSKEGHVGLPDQWTRDQHERKFVNRKTYLLKERRMNRRAKITQLMAQMQEEEENMIKGKDAWDHDDDDFSGDEIREERIDDDDLEISDEKDPDVKLDDIDPVDDYDSDWTMSVEDMRVRYDTKSLSLVNVLFEDYEQPETSSFKPGRSLQEHCVDSETHRAMLNEVEKFERRRQHSFNDMKLGARLKKYNSEGKGYLRYFAVNEEGTKLMWGKKPGRYTSSIHLAEVTRLEFGPFSERFAFYRWEKDKGHPWNCFSLHVYFPMRTVDIECNTSEQLRLWFLGLQSLIPIWASFYVCPGELLWSQINMKVDQLAMDLGISRAKCYCMLENGEITFEHEDLHVSRSRGGGSFLNRFRKSSSTKELQ